MGVNTGEAKRLIVEQAAYIRTKRHHFSPNRAAAQ